MTADRRRFLAAALAAPLATAASAADDAVPIIDTHQHLWDLKKFRLPWIARGSFLDRDYLPADYAAATKGLGIRQAVYLEVDVDPAQQLAEAEHLVALCRRGDTQTRAAVISGRPDADDFPAYIRRFKGSPYIKGIRRVLHGGGTPGGHATRSAFVKGIQLLGELGLHFELCMRHQELPDATRLVDACPGTRFILDHCGNPDLKKHERLEEGHCRAGKAQERRRQGVGHRRLGPAGQVDGGGSGAGGQAHPGGVRPRPRAVRQRLAGLPQGRDHRRLAEGAAADRRRPATGRAAQAVSRQRRRLLPAHGLARAVRSASLSTASAPGATQHQSCRLLSRSRTARSTGT